MGSYLDQHEKTTAFNLLWTELQQMQVEQTINYDTLNLLLT